ncbi:hypothetical protein [Streptomyces sp. x-80]|uniref:hypothetical protein n=1 Tax=Streptomyces sp. x-80 TaxID=2789282 RepID=UPI0039819427
MAQRLAVVARPRPGVRLRYLPRTTRRHLHVCMACVTHDRACARTYLARLSQAAGAAEPSQL